MKNKREIEFLVFKEIKSGNYKPGDKFLTETKIVALTGSTRMVVRQVIEKLKNLGIFYSGTGKNIIISKLAFHELKENEELIIQANNSIFLPTSNKLPANLIKEFDFSNQLFSSKDTLPYVRITFDKNDSTKVLSYCISWINTIKYNSLSKASISSNNFANFLLNELYYDTENTFERIYMEKESPTDQTMFKQDHRIKDSKVPTIYYADYSSDGELLRVGIRKYIDDAFKLNYISSQIKGIVNNEK